MRIFNDRFASVLRAMLVSVLAAGPLYASPAAPYIPEGLRAGNGEIEGQGALAVFPDEDLGPSPCTAHVVVESDYEVEAILPCGEWALPPAYGTMLRAWVESGTNMSPYPERFVPRNSAPGTMIRVSSPEAAGTVVLPSMPSFSGLVLRLLDVDPMPLRVGRLPHETLRSVPADSWEQGVLMPAGQAVGWLFDSDHQQIVALSKPFAVSTGAATVVPLIADGQQAHVAAVLSRASESREHDEEFEIELRIAGKARKPDLVVPTAARVYAFWYEAPSGTAELRAQSASSLLPLQQFEVKEGQVASIQAEMVRRPELEVELRLPPELLEGRLLLEVVRISSQEVVASRILAGRRSREIFEGLPADFLELQLATSLGTFTAKVDFSEAVDTTVRLEPGIIAVSGKVFLDDEGHPARLLFKTTRSEELEARADDDGNYHLLSVEKLKFVTIDLENQQAPFVDFFEKPLEGTQLLDFHLDARIFRVKVLDARSRQVIAGARIILKNSFPANSSEGEGRGSKEAPQKIVAQSVVSGTDGVAVLPSLRPGKLELRASATGYREPSEPKTYEISAEDRELEFEFLLEPDGPKAIVRIEKFDGSPAAGAEFLLVGDLISGSANASGTTDAEGLAAIPQEIPGLLLVRHPEAASQVFPWSASKSPEALQSPETLRLGLPASDLVLRIENSERRPIPGAQISLWIAGRKLSRSALSFFGRSRDRADQNGYIRLAGLPAAPFAVVAWARQQSEEGQRGAFDQQTTAFAFPWPETVVIQGIE